MLYLTSDHGGFAMKQRLVAWLRQQKIPFTDLGPDRLQRDDDYPVYATRLAKKVSTSSANRGIAVCRSGVGMAIVANKHRKIRAVQALTPAIAKQSRRDENTNVLSLAADYQSWSAVVATTKEWLATPYQGQARHARRLKQIARLEHGR